MTLLGEHVAEPPEVGDVEQAPGVDVAYLPGAYPELRLVVRQPMTNASKAAATRVTRVCIRSGYWVLMPC